MNLDSNMVTRRDEYNEIKDGKLLILIAKKQDRTALVELYERYLEPIDSFLRRAMRKVKLIDEVYNELRLTIWGKADSFGSDSKMSKWIFAIAYQQRMSHSRKETKYDHTVNSQLSQALAEHNGFAPNGGLQNAIGELPELHRTVIESMYFHGLNISEIAKIIKRSQNTVKIRLLNAHNHLKTTLKTEHTIHRS